MAGIDDQTFRAAMADLPAAVSIVTTTASDGSPRGATVSAITSVSLAPPRLLVCLDVRSDTLSALEVGRHFLVHVAADGQQDEVLRFAGKGAAKFASAAWAPGMSGQPQFSSAAVVFDCVVSAMVPAGDHTVVFGDIVEIEHDSSTTPIVYHRRRLMPVPIT